MDETYVVMLFNSKEDGAEFHSTGKATYLVRKTFGSANIAAVYASELIKHATAGQIVEAGKIPRLSNK